MPTPKATHNAKPLMPKLNPKLVKECVFPHIEGKRKHGHITMTVMLHTEKKTNKQTNYEIR